MNRIHASVTAITSVDNITIVSFESNGQPMRMMALELDETLEPGASVILGVKASGISLAKQVEGQLSISNRLDVTVEAVKNGALLCSVRLRFGDIPLESIITRESSQRMNLQPGDRVTALIKASELSVLEMHA
jgi:molybdopterin-binding protein